MASIEVLNNHFWDKQLLVNWCTGIIVHINGDEFIVVWDEADQRFRLKRFRAFPTRAAERVVDHPERWPLLVKESGQELFPFEWEQLMMKGKLAIVHVYTEEQFRRLGASSLPNDVANEVPKDDRKRTADVVNPEEDLPATKRARPTTVEDVFSADDSDSSCASDDCSSTQPLDDGPEEGEPEEEEKEMERTGLPVPLDFEVELELKLPEETDEEPPEYVRELVNDLNEDLSAANKNKWHRLSLDEQIRFLRHLRAFEMPLEYIRFSDFSAFTEEDDDLVRAWPVDKAYDGSNEDDRNAFIECMDKTEDIFDHESPDHQPTFLELQLCCHGRSVSFGSSYELSGSDHRLVTLCHRVPIVEQQPE